MSTPSWIKSYIEGLDYDELQEVQQAIWEAEEARTTWVEECRKFKVGDWVTPSPRW